MRLKEEHICGAFAWSPTSPNGQLIATGSVVGAMDEDFSSNAFLQIHKADLSDFSTAAMPRLAKATMHDRVNRIDWSTHHGTHGLIAGGHEDGNVTVYSADTLLANGEAPAEDAEDPLLCRIATHVGSVKGCQFNPLQSHFLATGGDDKDLVVWNLQNPTAPTKVLGFAAAAPMTDVRWNPKFSHILGTTMANGGVTAWDLRSKRAASNFSIGGQQGFAATTLAWNPDVATHVAVARDGPNPVIQIWNLTKATAPIRELSGHTDGILGLSWCQEDPSLLVSSGRDGRTIYWNPQTGDRIGEIAPQDNWVFDVAWAPRNPVVMASTSFDSKLTVHTCQDVLSSTGRSGPAPKWLSRPAPAVFGFGGRMALPATADTKKITITANPEPGSDSCVSQEKALRVGLVGTTAGSQERATFVEEQCDLPPVAAVARCAVAGTKRPMLELLGTDPESASDAVANIAVPFRLEEDEFCTLMSRCVVTGNFKAAVDLCLAADRFADAFAVAQLGTDGDVRRVHDAYTAKAGEKLRFAKYLATIAKKDFVALAQSAADLPWKEVLALFATHVPAQEFPAPCFALGEALLAAGDLEAAATCFVFGGDADRAVGVWAQQKKYDTPQGLVHAAVALEQTVHRECKAPEFATALADHANALAAGGDFANAMEYAARAARLGVHNAAVAADRVRFLVPSGSAAAAPFPFGQVTPVPDPVSQECAEMMHRVARARAEAQAQADAEAQRVREAQLKAQQEAARQEAQLKAERQEAERQAQIDAQRRAEQERQAEILRRQQMTAPHGGAALPPTHADPRAAGVAPMHGGQPQPVHGHPAMYHPPTSTPPPTTGGMVPGVAPAYGAPTGGVAPPLKASTSVNSGSAGGSPLVAGTPPLPHTTASPVPPSATSRASSAVPGAGQPSPVAAVNTASIPADQQHIVASVTAAVERMPRGAKRSSVEKAAAELLKQLGKGAVPPAVVALLGEFCSTLGQPQSKAAWEKLNDEHFDAVQHYRNIKFLA